jgi:hypothetical protein
MKPTLLGLAPVSAGSAPTPTRRAPVSGAYSYVAARLREDFQGKGVEPFIMTHDDVTKLRQAAYAADDAFFRELVRVYGERADRMRYRILHEDPGVQAAAKSKLAADAAWHAAVKKMRG